MRAKDAPARSEAYRRLVAGLPCILCGLEGQSQAAHGPTLGRGIKASDLDCFPLCCDRPGVRGCHGQFDNFALFDADNRRTIAATWAEQTRKALDGNQ